MLNRPTASPCGVTRPFWGANEQGLFQNAQGLFLGVRNAFEPRYS